MVRRPPIIQWRWNWCRALFQLAHIVLSSPPECFVSRQVRVGEKHRVSTSLASLVDAESLRNRERVSEILKLHSHNEAEANRTLEDMTAEDEEQ